MAFDGDPYRTLGLARGASLEEVKRAYRRLAKANHPDAAGSGALARFLAVQAAYEQLVGGSAGTRDAGRGPSGTSRRPSAADPARADATRRAYGARARPRRADGSPGQGAGSGDAAGPSSGSASTGRSTRGGETGRTDPDAGRRRGKATLGSTSYDDASTSATEPDWSGASWYGTSSGTYWTINPKEYADPRKHGPEYQARARRASTNRPRAGDGVEHRAEPPGMSGPDPAAEADDAQRRPTHEPTSWWSSTAGPTGPSASAAGPKPTERDRDGEAPPPREMPPRSDDPVPDPGRALRNLARSLADPQAGGLRGRVIRAFVGWLPVALGIGWIVGELTGCGRFAATCDPAVDPAILVVQGAALAGLLLAPWLAAVAAGAALTLLAVAVAVTLILSATGTAADEGSRRAALGGLLLLAWLAGLAIGIAQRVRAVSSRAGPVS